MDPQREDEMRTQRPGSGDLMVNLSERLRPVVLVRRPSDERISTREERRRARRRHREALRAVKAFTG